MIIDLISDIICPWCYIGKSRLSRAISRTNGEYDIQIRLRPFQLYPDIPKGGLAKEQFNIGRKPGMGTALKLAAKEEGLVFNFKHITHIPNTLAAHRLLHLCTNEEQKNALGQTLFVSYFEKAENVEDPKILTRLAKECGLSNSTIEQFIYTEDGRMEVQTAIQEWKADGVGAVPSFLLNEKHLIMGVQSVENWLRYFKRVG